MASKKTNGEHTMAKTHFRAIGNQGGVDPRVGVSGSSKSRRHYPVAQDAQFCMRKLWRKNGRRDVRCGNRRKCKKCLNYSEYVEETK